MFKQFPFEDADRRPPPEADHAPGAQRNPGVDDAKGVNVATRAHRSTSKKFSTKRSMIVLTLLVIASVLSASASASETATCENGGYLKVQGANGELFKNTGACTRYVSRGGTLHPIASLVASDVRMDCVFPLQLNPSGACWGRITGTGLLPGSIVYLYDFSTIYPPTLGFPLSADNAAPPPGTFDSTRNFLHNCGNGFYSYYATATTAAGQPIESNHVASPCG